MHYKKSKSVDTETTSEKSGNSYLIWLILGALWTGGLAFYLQDSPQTNPETVELNDPEVTSLATETEPIIAPAPVVSEVKKSKTWKESFATVKPIEERGFMLDDASGYEVNQDDTLTEHDLKNGMQVQIIGATEDGDWLRVRHEGIFDPVFIKADKIGRFK